MGYLPVHSSDGYSFGGGVIVTIGATAIPFGEGKIAERLARVVVERWNAGRGDV
jgi:hypothetical protein